MRQRRSRSSAIANSVRKLTGLSAGLFDVASEVWRRYGSDNGSLISAAVSFYVYLSLIPLSLLAVAAFGYALGSVERAQEIVIAFLTQHAPSLADVGRTGVKGAVGEIIAGKGIATGVGFAGLLWTGLSAVANLERGINVAWRAEETRGWLARLALSLATLLLIGVLLGVSFFVTAFFHAVRATDFRVLGYAPRAWPWFWSVVIYAAPLAQNIGVFTLIYKILPNARSPLGGALAGGIFAGVAWEIAKQVFSYYVAHFAGYSHIYGPLAGVALLMVWVNYTSVVTILGAELACVWSERGNRGRRA